ncbi:hypothetical protein [Mesorhizobium marinum]|uniref:hypothetical protein n=1 Tax=Mesorhizobium marinum TaxID=3228790 RepID=UPI0034665F6C
MDLSTGNRAFRPYPGFHQAPDYLVGAVVILADEAIDEGRRAACPTALSLALKMSERGA